MPDAATPRLASSRSITAARLADGARPCAAAPAVSVRAETTSSKLSTPDRRRRLLASTGRRS